MKLKRETRFGDELTCPFKIDIRNLTNFFHFNGFLLSKIYIVQAKKEQRSYLS